jgi:hypothetical protein
MPDYYTGYYDESRLRGGGVDPGYVPDASTPINTQFTYTNGQHFAGTGVPISDQALALMQYSQNGIARDRDVTGTGGVGRSLTSAANFELDHIGNIFEGLVDEPGRLVFGFDPIGTKIGETVTGREYDPLVNQMGGATSQQIRDYEAKHGTNSAGGAQGLHNAAAGTAGIVAAGTLANGGFGGGGQSGTNLYTMTPAEQAQITSGLTNVPAGVSGSPVMGFGGAGTGGIPSQLSMGSASQYGAAGNGLVLEGGAGTIGGGWLSALNEYGPKVAGLLDQGGGGGGSAPMAMPSMGGMMGSQVQPAMQPQRRPQPLDQSMTRFRGYGRTPLQFKGQTIWL